MSKNRNIFESKEEYKVENICSSLIKMTIGGELEQAIKLEQPIIIITDAETDDARAIVQILKATNYILAANAFEQVANIYMVVGDGTPLIRLNIIKDLVDRMYTDGYIGDNNVKVTYIIGEKGAVDHDLYESMMQNHIRITETGDNIGLLDVLKNFSHTGSLIYGLKEPQELLSCFNDNHAIFANSTLYTYFGGHNYKTSHGPVIELLDSFQSVKGFSNYITLQGKNANKARDITAENTPKFVRLMIDSHSKTIEFLKLMTTAWNSEIVYRFCTYKLQAKTEEIITMNKENVLKSLENNDLAEITKYTTIEAVQKNALENLHQKVNAIRNAENQIDIRKIDIKFIESLHPEFAALPQKFPINMLKNVTKEPELQSVIADDLPAIASFMPQFIDVYTKGRSKFINSFLDIDAVEIGNLELASKAVNHDIAELDCIEEYIMSDSFMPSELIGEQMEY